MIWEEVIILLISGKDVVFGAIGGIVAYCYDYLKARKEKDPDFEYRTSSVLMLMIMGGFVAYGVGTGVPTDFIYRDILVMTSGVTAYHIIFIADTKFAQWLVSKIPGFDKKEKDN